MARRKKPTATKEWRKILCGLPGYDPFAQAGDCWFDEKAAQDVLDFFAECLKHIEGEVAGQPFILQPWQVSILANLFGWKKLDEKGRTVRRYREAFILVPRKNGKTPLVAGICNYVLFCDGERGAQIYCAAAEKEQAAIVYKHAKGMIEQEPELESRAKIYKAHKSIVLKHDEASVLKVLSADADTKHGGNSHLVVIDELHAQPNRDLVDVLETSMASANRAQPMMIHITTSDFERPSICNEKYAYACRVRDNKGQESQPGYDPSFLPVIYEASIDDDWRSEDTWRKANPNYGISVSEGYMRDKCRKAQEEPSFENTFKRLNLNIRTKTDEKWLDTEQWTKCRAIFDESTLRGRLCYSGLDLSSKIDVTAHVLVFPPTDDDPLWRVLPRFFIPSENAEKRERRDRVQYLTWSNLGHVTLTPGNVVDYEYVKESIQNDAREFRLQQIAYDPWNATQIALQLADAGANVIEFGQGFRSMSEPAKELEKLITAGTIRHNGNECLTWMIGNAVKEEDPAGNIKPSKKKSTERIDGVVALTMALGVAMVTPEEEASIYEQKGALRL